MLTIVVGLVMLLQFSAKTSVYIHFLIHQQEIASTACEQRYVPHNCCQGSCVLEKDLAKSDQNEGFPYNIIRKLSDVEFFLTIELSPVDSYVSMLTQSSRFSNLLTTQIWSEEIPKPPCVLL